MVSYCVQATKYQICLVELVLLTFHSLTTQVAFSMDFSQDQYVQSLAGDQGLPFLINNVFEGMIKGFKNPLAKVSISELIIFGCSFGRNLV